MRVENLLVNESRFISQVLVLGSGRDYVGALVYPDLGNLRDWAADRGVPPKNLLTDPAVRELYASELERINTLVEVKYQRIRRALLADREPSLSAGEMTPSAKLVRKTILANYEEQTDALFAPRPSEEIIEVPQQAQQRTASCEA